MFTLNHFLYLPTRDFLSIVSFVLFPEFHLTPTHMRFSKFSNTYFLEVSDLPLTCSVRSTGYFFQGFKTTLVESFQPLMQCFRINSKVSCCWYSLFIPNCVVEDYPFQFELCSSA